MLIELTSKKIIFSLLFLFCTLIINAQFTVNAGPDVTICPGQSTTLGGTPAATGGPTPFTYSWSPSTGISSTTVANPVATPTITTSYTLKVTNDSGIVKTDVIKVTLNPINEVNAGSDISVCENDTIQLGGIHNINNGITYAWSPNTALNDTTLPHPVCTPLHTTVYTLTASTAGCPSKTTFVTITLIATPSLNAGNDTTILEGATITLNGSGGFFYNWNPKETLTYDFTAHPNAEPVVTTMYYLWASDATNKCVAFDSVLITVIPSNQIFIYNTFTPNGDGENDTWYIGNLYKYPDNHLKIYNRYAKVVYQTDNYISNWDGKSFGVDLPAGTYFYDLDLGEDKDKFHGTVTIVR